ncbi:hypothetical protein [Papillibacter cinnamivorans]|uniref:hypothetical protein n=1 Tax=Papillibacter cinnamivorans TaxID=100176 RepID=UPI00117C071A|nr:hypothetical protein [Papillibacter cinnamivorans]
MNQDISSLLINQLRKELPLGLQDWITKFETQIYSGNYRIAYSILEELKHMKGWSPSQILLGYYEKFWWELAN